MHDIEGLESVDLRTQDARQYDGRTAKKRERAHARFTAALGDPKRARSAYGEIIDYCGAGVLTMSERALLHCLTQFADSDLSNCFPAQKTIAARLGISRWWTNRLMQALEKKGFIVLHFMRRENGTRSTNGIEFCVPKGAITGLQWRSGMRFTRRGNP